MLSDLLSSSRRWRNKMHIPDFPFTLRQLSQEEGGGYFIEFPDLPGCISDGETLEEAIANGYDAVQSWIAVAKERNRVIPTAGNQENLSGKWVQRVPRSLHAKLVKQAKRG